MKATLARILLLVACAGLVAGCEDEDEELLDAAPYGGAHVWGAAEAGAVNGRAAGARFNNPANVEVGTDDGTVYIADFDNNLVRAISPGGIVRTLVAKPGFQRPFGLTWGFDNFLYVQTDDNDSGAHGPNTGTVWKVDPDTGAATVVARDIGRPRGLMALPDGRIALSDLSHNALSLLDPDTGAVTPLAGLADTAGFADGTGTAARFDRPYGLALDEDGTLLVADQNNNRIRRVTLAGVVTTFAGSGVAGNADGALLSATFRGPQDVEIVGSTVFVAEPSNHVIRRIAGGSVTTFAGNGTAGFVDADGTAAAFFGLEGIATTPFGHLLFVADGNGGSGDPFNRVRFISTGL
ncbi:MAG TPA: hypothetical protein VM369_09185 [Candidatus Binatia bacterium]|nr:hypothetical protein [Candidatus Binatia bacterium]